MKPREPGGGENEGEPRDPLRFWFYMMFIEEHLQLVRAKIGQQLVIH